MLTDQDSVKIADFGLSKLRGETAQMPDGLVVATPFYAAPEQLETPDQADFRADIYSVGVMLYRMLTGTLPTTPAIPPGEMNRDLDAGWDDFFHRAMDANPDRRFPDARVMLGELTELYNGFKEKMENECRIPEESRAEPAYPRPQAGPEKTRPRSAPMKVNVQKAKTLFFVDELWRPTNYTSNRLALHSADTVIDLATDLIWQRSGSAYTLNWEQAKNYILTLNEARTGGISNWRLPTANELISLLNPPPPGEDFCFESLFSSRQKWIWSADRRSFRSAWYVNVEMGFVASHDVTGFFYAKAVCHAP